MVFAAFRERLCAGLVYFQVVFPQGASSRETSGSTALHAAYLYDSWRQAWPLPVLSAGLLPWFVERLLGNLHAVERGPGKPWRHDRPSAGNVVVLQKVREKARFRFCVAARPSGHSRCVCGILHPPWKPVQFGNLRRPHQPSLGLHLRA